MTYNTMFVIIVILIIFYWVCEMRKSEKWLDGFWVAEDDAFCEISQINSMMLFVDSARGFLQRSRICYLIINPGIANQPMLIEYLPGCGKIKARVTANDNVWPSHIVIETSIENGSMKITDTDGTLLAKLYKRHDMDYKKIIKSVVWQNK